MLSSILEDVKGQECRQNFARAKGLDWNKGKEVFKINKGGKYNVER